MFPVRMSPGSASQQPAPLSWRRASARLMQRWSWTAASRSSCAPQAATWSRVVRADVRAGLLANENLRSRHVHQACHVCEAPSSWHCRPHEVHNEREARRGRLSADRRRARGPEGRRVMKKGPLSEACRRQNRPGCALCIVHCAFRLASASLLHRRQLAAETPCAAGERGQPGELQVGPCPEQLHHWRRQPRPVDGQPAPVRTPAVVVREAVAPGKLPRAEKLSGVFDDLGIARQRRNGAPDVERRLRLEKVADPSYRRRASSPR